MLLETAPRPITHFPVPAKELSDSGSCSHGSDLKLWPQRNATCPTSHDTELSASLYGVRQLRFGCQSCCLHWAKKSYSLSGSWGLSHSIFPAQRRLAVLKRSNPTELPRENFSPTIHPCWLLIAWKSRWVSNRGTILTDNCTCTRYRERQNGKRSAQLATSDLWEGEWPISKTGKRLPEFLYAYWFSTISVLLVSWVFATASKSTFLTQLVRQMLVPHRS